jgi:hypothetical protein
MFIAPYAASKLQTFRGQGLRVSTSPEVPWNFERAHCVDSPLGAIKRGEWHGVHQVGALPQPLSAVFTANIKMTPSPLTRARKKSTTQRSGANKPQTFTAPPLPLGLYSSPSPSGRGSMSADACHPRSKAAARLPVLRLPMQGSTRLSPGFRLSSSLNSTVHFTDT